MHISEKRILISSDLNFIKKNLPECPRYQICNGFCCETLMLILNFENLPMLTSLSPAVRHDRMRGGRNKFGPMYKRDRARKLQVHPMLQVQLWVLIGDLCSKCHQVWSFVINPPFPNDWHNFKLPPICPTDQVSRLFCTISNSFFFLEGTVTPCRYYTF